MRKPRSLGNFSIETSYKSMRDAWPSHAPLPQVHVVGHFTSGIADRWHIWREVHSAQAPLVHITGDIHFAAIGFRNAPVILTIHDLGMLDQGRFLERWIKKCFWLTWPLKSCAQLIAVSEETKRDILRRTGYRSDRIHVIPSVISPSFHARTSNPVNPKPRALHIGVADNKNLEGHAKALVGLDVHLRIIGVPTPSQVAMLDHLRVDYSCTSKLTEAQLQAEYAASDVLLFCSTLEGYGMPIIEAQTVGVPVITSQRPPLDDTAGDGALLVDPERASTIHEAIQKVISDPKLRHTLVAKGRKNAKRYNAESSAKRHAKVYEQARAAER